MRRVRPAVATTSLALLSACATSPPAPTPTGENISTGQDCAVFAAIARDHYEFASHPPPPLWQAVPEEDGGEYQVRCEWARMGVPMSGDIYDPDRPRSGRNAWVRFERPVYLGQRARVATALSHGPLAGMGYECEVVSGIDGWTVEQCRSTWVS